MQRLVYILLLGTLASNFTVEGSPLPRAFMAEGPEDVARIARAISLVQPFRPDHKYVQYALAIYKASRRYAVDPAVLIAIAQQETSFREDLPEGRAGELGICQVLKRWASHRGFAREFGKVRRKDFLNAEKSFLYAAWILKALSQEKRHGATLPFWSYYNARKFHNRFKYFVAVNRHLAVLKRNESEFRGMGLPFLVASNIQGNFGAVKRRVARVQRTTPTVARLLADATGGRLAGPAASSLKAGSFDSFASVPYSKFTVNASVGDSIANWFLRLADRDPIKSRRD